jgi:4-amino-4-deoxy-L-arabinose transferase-like glycosyltransferase
MVTLGLVGIITIAYLLFTKPKQIFSRILSLHPIMALLIILAIAAPYYVWAHQTTHGAFTETFFLRQNLGRLAGAVNHVNPWWWYIPVVIGGFLPWSLLWVPARNFLFRLIRRRAQLSSAREQVLFFSFCWAVAGFVFLSAIPTKLQTYIVPIFPALALMCGNYIDILMRKNRPSPLVLSAAGMLAIAVAW